MSKKYYDLFSDSMSELEVGELYRETFLLLRAGHWPASYVDVIMQSSHCHLNEPADILAFANVHAWIASGKVWKCTILIHHAPHPDNEVELNNLILSGIPEPFVGEFIPEKGYSADRDGYIQASQPFLADNEWSANRPEERILPIARFPLEVGSTKSYTTYRHLMESGRVARWPYGSERIHLLDMHEYLGEIKQTVSAQLHIPRIKQE